MEIDLWQGRGLPFDQDAPRTCLSPINRRSLKTKTDLKDMLGAFGLPGERSKAREKRR